MRLPDDYEQHNIGITPTVVSAIVAVTLFVVVILGVVFAVNRQPARNPMPENPGLPDYALGGAKPPTGNYPNTKDLVTGSTLSPDDLDFWDKYPEPTEQSTPAPTDTPAATTAESDPATDGKHVLVKNRNGKEEWVLISPYLPKHEYDFTKLVCQSNQMKYYVDSRKVSFLGVEITKYQEYVDFVKLKKAGADFVMLRVGTRGYGSGQLVLDESFTDNIKRATDAGLEVGVYFSSQAVTVEEAVEEANLVLEYLDGYNIRYPVAFCMGFVENDTARIETLSKTDKTNIAKTFLDTVAAAGYQTMLGGDKEWLIKEVDMSKLTAYDVWLTEYADVPDYPYRFAMWRYTSEGSMDGVNGYVNLSISFIDYSEK